MHKYKFINHLFQYKRDGAPIELTALLKHCLNFIIRAYKKGFFPYNKVVTKLGKTLSYEDWSY